MQLILPSILFSEYVSQNDHEVKNTLAISSVVNSFQIFLQYEYLTGLHMILVYKSIYF